MVDGQKTVKKGRKTAEFIAQQGKGRPKGCKNKFTDLRTAFINAFQAVGHEEYVKDFARDKRNAGRFLELVTKMLPREVEAKFPDRDGNPQDIGGLSNLEAATRLTVLIQEAIKRKKEQEET